MLVRRFFIFYHTGGKKICFFSFILSFICFFFLGERRGGVGVRSSWVIETMRRVRFVLLDGAKRRQSMQARERELRGGKVKCVCRGGCEKINFSLYTQHDVKR